MISSFQYWVRLGVFLLHWPRLSCLQFAEEAHHIALLFTFLLNNTLSVYLHYLFLCVLILSTQSKNIKMPSIKMKEKTAFRRHLKVLGSGAVWRHSSQTRKAVYKVPLPFASLGTSCRQLPNMEGRTLHSALPAPTLLLWHKDIKIYHSMLRKLYSHTLPLRHPWYRD